MRVAVWQADGEPFEDGRGYGAAVIDRLRELGHDSKLFDHTSSSFSGLDELNCDLVILTGGSTPVHQRDSWMPDALHNTRELLRRAQNGFGPAVLGICLGSQMIAAATARDVDAVRQDGVMEAGFVKLQSIVEKVEDNVVNVPKEPSFAFHYHYIDPSAINDVGGTVLTRSSACPVQEFVIPGPIVGSQSHPEFGPKEAKLLFDANADVITSTGGDLSEAIEQTHHLESSWSNQRLDWLISMAMERRLK